MGSSASYGAQCSIFLARVCVPVSTRTSSRGEVSRRANRLKVRSPGFDEWDDFCENRPLLFGSPRFNAPITMRAKAMVSWWDPWMNREEIIFTIEIVIGIFVFTVNRKVIPNVFNNNRFSTFIIYYLLLSDKIYIYKFRNPSRFCASFIDSLSIFLSLSFLRGDHTPNRIKKAR